MPRFRPILREARSTLALAIPMTAGQVGQMLLGFVDTLMVGRLGVVPLAASAFAVGIFNVLFITGLGLVAGVSVLAARAHGADRPGEAGEVLRHGLVISLASSLAMVAILLACLPALGRLHEPPEVPGGGPAVSWCCSAGRWCPRWRGNASSNTANRSPPRSRRC